MSEIEMTAQPGLSERRVSCYHEDVHEIKLHNIKVGQHFFDEGAMRFFSSRVHSKVYGGRFFVTSEQDAHEYGAWNGERRYTVRECLNGYIETCGGFGEFATARDAQRLARRLAEQVQ